jgi:septum site-determining protein MinD
LDTTSNSRAAQAFDNIARRLCGEKVPYLDLDVDRDNLFTRIRKIFVK